MIVREQLLQQNHYSS